MGNNRIGYYEENEKNTKVDICVAFSKSGEVGEAVVGKKQYFWDERGV